MKKFLLLSMLFLSLGTVNACMKKSLPPTIAGGQPLTVIVMDTTQALLPNAQVKVQRDVYTTSFDGRVVLKPEQVTSSTFLVSCEGYKKSHVIVKDSSVLIVRLIPDPKKARPSNEREYATLGMTRAGVMYSKAAVPMASSAEYIAMEESAVMDRVVPGVVDNSPVGAGRLTAGEVNDFAKWYFWPSVLDGTHKQYEEAWKIAPRHRYTVQVVDQHGYPIVSRAVSLLDQAGNTLFQAVTDNTGKAELWYQLLGNQVCGKHTDFQVRVDDQTQIAKQWVDGGNTFVLNEECANEQLSISNSQLSNSSDVDVMFVFDATGSMGDELRYLQAEMKDVISRATNATGGLKIRTGSVVYRDHGDEYLTRISRLTENISETQAFIDKQQANGGGDYPEAVPEALMAALNSGGWNEYARTRIAFLILDAPCHGDSATIALLHDQILNAASMGVRIVPVVCSGIGESGELLVRSMALATNGTSFFLTDDSGIGHTHLKPTTDSLKVEHLNDMLVRTIVEFSYMPDCRGHWHEEQIEQIEAAFIPQPFQAEDIAADPSIPHGPTTLYLMDVSGKLIHVYEGVLEEASDSQLAKEHIHLSTGVYFVMAFYDGKWHSKKVLVH